MVLEGLLTSQECDDLRQRMSAIVDEADVPEHCRTTFSTDQEEQLREQVAPPVRKAAPEARRWFRFNAHHILFPNFPITLRLKMQVSCLIPLKLLLTPPRTPRPFPPGSPRLTLALIL